ncbi:MAG TPA: TIM barrel protein [Bryobacteraceae bacterium]|nr:TIM barrel protein [Bryobacteraceae bacterium]HPT24950.1 TIM barrel protein [Bryobacteraceae bacterium]
MDISRRDVGKLALAGLPAALPAQTKPNSKFGGIQVGINIPYSFHGLPSSADQILGYLAQTGISAAELRTQPIEAFLGAPAGASRGVGDAVAAPRQGQLTPAQEAAQKAEIAELKKWRLSRPMSDFKTFRKKYEDAGVLIEIVKMDRIDAASDETLDYCFQMAKTLGAYAISCEIPVSKTKRLGQFAAKHKLMVGYHGHGNLTNPEAFGRLGAWEQAFWYSKYNGANVDIGHFFASNGFSPAEWIRENHTRITHVHLKDRKANNGPGMPWGQGDTPLKEILLMMRREKYKFQATIELEYQIPKDSTVLAEISKCVQYAKQVLES